MAAVMATNIDEMLRKESKMKLATSVFWSDSMAVLGYIRNRDKKFEVFVANRLSKIHESTTVGQWNHVPTDQNPADDASRGIKSKALQGRWLNGPKFLLKGEREWPSSTECTVTNRCDPTIEASRDCRDTQELTTDPANSHKTKTRQERQHGDQQLDAAETNHYNMKARQESCQDSREAQTPQATVHKIEAKKNDNIRACISDVINRYSSFYRLTRAVAVFQKLINWVANKC